MTDNSDKIFENETDRIQEVDSDSHSHIAPEGNSGDFPESDFGIYTEIEDSAPEKEVENNHEESVSNKVDEIVSPIKKNSASAKSSYSSSFPQPRKGNWIKYMAVVAGLLLIVFASFAVIIYSVEGDLYPSGERVAVIYLQGTMITGSIPSGYGYVTSEEIIENIREAVDDESVKAIVLRINSGGGSAVAGEEIYNEVKRAREMGVPVVASIGDIGASAAYYAASASDVIVVNPNTMTGSIGVIWVFTNMSAYYEEEGIEYYVAKSGDFKDMGSSWRGLTDEEKEYADDVVMEVYTLFIEDVAKGRNMTISEVEMLADGRIYTGANARRLGLVDEFGNLYDSIEIAAELAGIEGEPDVYYVNKPSLSSLLFGSEASIQEIIRGLVSYYKESPFGVLTA
ncbi:signal peptide peptidase SppA [Methanohalophilus sp.]|uniref:signal peptide peptidase SppA n=1 Tax=Methanohalophilus sp. TaxID=1966352 RepID=UPI00260E1128|nr:signal peptide peptidase SppA [Methanohalophilus sp.]MDK2891893.1 protease [Methanohalophilus sp.]